MSHTRRQFLYGSARLALVSKLGKPLTWTPALPISSNQSTVHPYGSGNFGAWIEDEFALPAFKYTMDQTEDPRAFTDVRPGLLSPTEHVHQVGNDRIIALASNYGHLRVRQDEGSPKLLNDFDPEFHQFAGGFGYLVDDRGEMISTNYDGQNPGFERIFGIGYYRKRVSGQSYNVDQIVSAPYGDDPVLISRTTVSNRRGAAATVRWVEYWGCQPFQFSYRSALETRMGTRTQTEWRRDLGRRFHHRVTPIEGGKGLLESKQFIGRSPVEEAAWEATMKRVNEHPGNFNLPIGPLQPGTEFESLNLPQTFLVSLDGPISGFSSDAAAFFGDGGATQPNGLIQPLRGTHDESGNHTGLFIERVLRLEPGESRTVSFLYGYLPKGFSLNSLVKKYESLQDTVLQTSSREWKEKGLRFKVPGEPWIEREATWNHYYLRSSLTFDSFFGEHILNQNGFYQYTMGFQGAARDPLQHCLPFLFSDPEIVKSVLRYTFKEIRDDGSLPYAIVGHGVIAPMLSDRASDLPLWLLWATSEYVLATRDVAFLQEKIPMLFSTTVGSIVTVRKLLERCYRHQVTDVGTGRHGIMRMLADDWNDGLMATWAASDMAECIETSESVLNSAMASWVYDRYAEMLAYTRENEALAQALRRSAGEQRDATRAQWNGKWFRRAWLGPKLGWLGETTLWIEPQPWAILAGATSDSQTRELVETMDQLLRQGPLGAIQMSDGPDMRSGNTFDHGTLELGAVWPSLNQTLVWALAGVDSAMAWEEWKRNTLACHAENYPDLWYGVWSGNDSYNTPLSKHPGAAADERFFRGTDFPVLNLHAHACSLYSASKLLGINFTARGLKLNLQLPLQAYSFESPLVGIRRVGRRFEGWYQPSQPGAWAIEMNLPDDLAAQVSHIRVNGESLSIQRDSNATMQFQGSGGPNKPLRWVLELA